MIIGVTGTIGAGKDTVLDYLVAKGFSKFSFSDLIREEARKRGYGMGRKSLEEFGDLIRKEHGDEAVFAGRILREINERGIKDAVAGGIRQPWEIREFRNKSDFFLIAVDADQKARFERTRNRGGSTDTDDLEEFREFDRREYEGKGSTHQQIKASMDMADFIVQNNGSYEELYKQVDDILKKLHWKA